MSHVNHVTIIIITYDMLCMYISELQVTTNYLVHNVILYIIYYLIRAILS